METVIANVEADTTRAEAVHVPLPCIVVWRHFRVPPPLLSSGFDISTWSQLYTPVLC